MKEIIIYKAFDGKEFDNKEDCLTYESTREDGKSARAMLLAIKNICLQMGETCKNCPFYDEGFCGITNNGIPCEWEP